MGLLNPGARSEGGQRLYVAPELERLQQIVSLRQLGFGLDEIRTLLHRPEMSALEVVELHLSRVDERIADLTTLQHRLRLVSNQLRRGESTSFDVVSETVEMMTMVEKHYSPEQLEWLQRRREEVGETRIQEVEAEWPQLIDEVVAAIDRGIPPGDPHAQALARRWTELVREFTGSNQEIEGAVQRVWEVDGEQLVQQHGLNPRMSECAAYISQALAGSADA